MHACRGLIVVDAAADAPVADRIGVLFKHKVTEILLLCECVMVNVTQSRDVEQE